MTAREKFTKGQRVRSTDVARAYVVWIDGERRYGTVVGFSPRHPEFLAVLVDGIKTRQRFHMKFWEPLK